MLCRYNNTLGRMIHHNYNNSLAQNLNQIGRFMVSDLHCSDCSSEDFKGFGSVSRNRDICAHASFEQLLNPL